METINKNLNLNQIKEACELVEGYTFMLVLSRPSLNIKIGVYGKTFQLDDAEDPLTVISYRDFLQLVIEAIEKKEIAHFGYDYYNGLIQIFNNICLTSESYLETVNSKDLTECKEKAISYVLDMLLIKKGENKI